MSKFKVGDTVKTTGGWTGYGPGERGVVVEVDTTDSCIPIRVDFGSKCLWVLGKHAKPAAPAAPARPHASGKAWALIDRETGRTVLHDNRKSARRMKLRQPSRFRVRFRIARIEWKEVAK
jgi:hypothetical protein